MTLQEQKAGCSACMPSFDPVPQLLQRLFELARRWPLTALKLKFRVDIRGIEPTPHVEGKAVAKLLFCKSRLLMLAMLAQLAGRVPAAQAASVTCLGSLSSM